MTVCGCCHGTYNRATEHCPVCFPGCVRRPQVRAYAVTSFDDDDDPAPVWLTRRASDTEQGVET